MVLLERYTILWYSGFTYSRYFSYFPQLSLFNIKSANIKNFSTRGICTRGNSTEDVYIESASIISACAENTLATGVCAKRV